MRRHRAVILAITATLTCESAAAAPPPRTPDGRPDFNGVWTNVSVTQLTRSPNQPKLVVTEAEAQTIARSNYMVQRIEKDSQKSDLNDGLLSDKNTEAGYNTFWMDPGVTLAKVRGQYRTSWLVDPADGQLPLTDAGKAQQRKVAARLRAAPSNPEDLAPNDRCLIGSRGSGGPGMLNNLYNNNYQIVQTRDAVGIWVEMVHDVRDVKIFASKAAAQAGHRPAAMNLWLGDSVAWWEGQTLVVETTNVHPTEGQSGPIFLSPAGRVTERFSRPSADEIDYAFEVEDPVYYTRSWRAEMSLRPVKGQVFEYACHEGNYALSGILAGARADEAKARPQARTGE